MERPTEVIYTANVVACKRIMLIIMQRAYKCSVLYWVSYSGNRPSWSVEAILVPGARHGQLESSFCAADRPASVSTYHTAASWHILCDFSCMSLGRCHRDDGVVLAYSEAITLTHGSVCGLSHSLRLLKSLESLCRYYFSLDCLYF